MVGNFVRHLQRTFPNIPVEMLDERFTSKMAMQSMIASGMKKKYRKVKENVDIISATIILQSYLEKVQR
jgi:putative Holliday junction resolvase